MLDDGANRLRRRRDEDVAGPDTVTCVLVAAVRYASGHRVPHVCMPVPLSPSEGGVVGSVIKKRRKRMAKKKHRKLLKRTRVQRRNKK
jgi:hypothetical protein